VARIPALNDVTLLRKEKPQRGLGLLIFETKLSLSVHLCSSSGAKSQFVVKIAQTAFFA
jgi:hypothetical protein